MITLVRRLLLLLLPLALPSLLGAPAGAATSPRLEERWPGIHLVWFDEKKTKSVVAEFDGFLALVEAPHDDATVRALLGLLGETFPDKPVRFAFHTHHHGHSLGALDPLLAAEVTVVSSPWNLGKIRDKSSAPAAFDARALLIPESFTLEDGSNALTAYVIKQESYEVPTDEYMIVHFPREEMVVSGCLFNKPLTYFEVVNTRKTSLDAFLTDRALPVAWLVPTATCEAGGFEDVSAHATLKETLEKGIKPWEVADRLESRSVEELRAGMSDLAEEFASLTPRAYDIVVCAGYLEKKREDLDRALVLYEVAVSLHPEDFWARYALAGARALGGEKDLAREGYERALELATSEAGREMVRGKIAALDEPEKPE
jgi:hypothetical protein